MNKVCGFLLGLFLTTLGFAQGIYHIKPENADCKKPVEIKDTIFGPTNPPSGHGELMEISGAKNSLYEFEKEHNTCWYFFKAKYDAVLEMEIIPVNIRDDYDFILYRYSGRNFCLDVSDKKIIPVRSCISRNDKALKSRTGLSNEAPEEYIHSGPGASFSKSLRVKKGEIYYLVVDNVYPQGGGHTVILHYSGYDKKAEPVKPPEKTANKTKTKPPQNTTPKNVAVTINTIDKDSKKAVASNIKVYYKDKPALPPAAASDSVITYVAELAPSTAYNIKTEAINYFDNATSIKTNADGQSMSVTIELTRIKTGQNVVFENILFYGNTAEILPESKPALEAIYSTMKRYPALHIEIQGHVNCPTTWEECSKMKEHNMQLSVNRAKAIYDYLEDGGIDPQKMTFKGFGETKMIYPDARSEDKMKKNRRVEILVTAVE
ncbi:MAG TPA: OmpA family protein [Bacteroidales bacterium]|nr:OmpA family protein [Bacteroidales bacterium]HNZ42300.1 OmpA family protein [Bacteroidales bacterium]HOH84059.1 OmpA family protein [Bacteroidales bacterium]HPB24862.1 OmpA family protein [Bacteroidales bacterium]HPI29494.1 OmpA family protein [Bacteroidales bacterium]